MNSFYKLVLAALCINKIFSYVQQPILSKVRTLFLRLLYVLFVAATVSACGTQNNVFMTTSIGTCADGTTSAPYCMGITINNNNESNAQNWINSTNYPIQNIVINVSGANNISYPGNGSTNQDPNGCMSSSISPGASCTVYLQLNTESYAVGSQTAMTVNITYNVQNSLFGTSSTNGSAGLTVHQQSNLYGITGSGILNVYNYGGISQISTESSTQSYPSLLTIAMDNNSYGYIYTSNQNGVFYFGNPGDANGDTNYLSGSTFESSGTSNFNNLWSNGNMLYTATNGYGVWQTSITSLSWNLLYNVSYSFYSNINAMSSSGSIYLVSSTGSQVYLCISSTTSTCSVEGAGLSGTANDLGTSSSNFTPYGYTGLYAATTGLYAESGTTNSATNSWTQVTGPSVATTAIVSDNAGNLYISDISGNIYKILASTTTPTTADLMVANIDGSTQISQMIVDNSGEQLLVLNSSGNLYGCPLSGSSCTLLESNFNAAVVGLGIGSQLTN